MIFKSKKRKGDWVQVHSGIRFYPLDPRPDEINIEDIAHSLSMQCRFNGHIKQFYSVAEHSVYVAHIAENLFNMEAFLPGLLHDSPETYIGDMVRPVKSDMKYYRKVEKNIEKVIINKFELSEKEEVWKAVKKADMMLLSLEHRQLMDKFIPWDTDILWDTKLNIQCMEPKEAEQFFLDNFRTKGYSFSITSSDMLYYELEEFRK